MVSEEAGFLLTGAVVLWGNLWWFWRRPLAAIFVSLLTVVLIQISFGSLMKVPLPMGWLEPIQGVFSWK
jgi:putative tricarboxylic transport membrane protein